MRENNSSRQWKGGGEKEAVREIMSREERDNVCLRESKEE
tara:strand:- start:1130 stop:1249 length:120 start_codon:yes stop_codon:yes gene_type:complete